MENLRFSDVLENNHDYRKIVMTRAWQDFKMKKKHKAYDDWTFAKSLYWAHRHINAIKK